MARQTKWTSDMIAKATYLCSPDGENLSYDEAVAEMAKDWPGIKFTGEGIRGQLRIRKRKKNEGNLLTFPEQPPETDWEKRIDYFEEAARVRNELDPQIHEAKVKIDVDYPIAVSFITDAHLGSRNTQYDWLRQDLKLVAGDPRFFVIFGGDTRENFMVSFKNAKPVLEQIQSPQIQVETARVIFDAFEKMNKVVAYGGGNHDEMDVKRTGIDTTALILRGHKPPYLPQGGLLQLIVGGQTYKIIWKHRATNNSKLNKFNAHHNLRRMLYLDGDIYVTEHLHDPGIETVEEGEYDCRRTVVNIRTGAYKTDDEYSMMYFKAGRRGAQTVILMPDRHHIIPVHSIDGLTDAKVWLDGFEKTGKKEGNSQKA